MQTKKWLKSSIEVSVRPTFDIGGDVIARHVFWSCYQIVRLEGYQILPVARYSGTTGYSEFFS